MIKGAQLRFHHVLRYMIGRALRIVKIHTQMGSVAGTNGRVRYDPGDLEIAVEWFQRDASGGDERRIFRAWTPDRASGDVGPMEGHEYTFNSTELRLISSSGPAAGNAIALEMCPLPPLGGVPLNIVQTIARSSARLATQPRPNYTNVTYQATQVRADPPQQRWEISTGSERVVLDNCW